MKDISDKKYLLSPFILLKLLLRNWMAAVLRHSLGDNTASVRIHFCVDPKWAIHKLNNILPLSLCSKNAVCPLMGATKHVQGVGVAGSDTLTSHEGDGGEVETAPLVEGCAHRVEVGEKQARDD